MLKFLLYLLGRCIFKLRGWTFEPLPDYWEKKQILIGFPHTTNMDTVMALAAFGIIKTRGYVLVKEEAFKWPYGGLLKSLGAIPVNRQKKEGVVGQMCQEFSGREEFQLSMVPEGTRKKNAKLKTGFWYIAKAAQVPIICWYLDNKNKRTVWAGRVFPGETLEKDLEKIKSLYSTLGHEIK